MGDNGSEQLHRPSTMSFEQPLPATHRRLRTELGALARKMPAGSRLEFDIDPGELFLKVFMVPRSQRGCGSMWLARMLEACDRAAVPVHLNVDPTDEPGDPETFDLVRWYHSFGFVPRCATEDGVFMDRPVQTPRPFQKMLASRTNTPRLSYENYEQIARLEDGPTAPTRLSRPSMG